MVEKARRIQYSRATHPEFRYYKEIIRFLGYCPFPVGQTAPEKLVQYRKIRGLSQKGLARLLKVDPGTLSRWERGRRLAPDRFLTRIERLLKQLGAGLL